MHMYLIIITEDEGNTIDEWHCINEMPHVV